jgi:hypothetical protein
MIMTAATTNVVVKQTFILKELEEKGSVLSTVVAGGVGRI